MERKSPRGGAASRARGERINMAGGCFAQVAGALKWTQGRTAVGRRLQDVFLSGAGIHDMSLATITSHLTPRPTAAV